MDFSSGLATQTSRRWREEDARVKGGVKVRKGRIVAHIYIWRKVFANEALGIDQVMLT